MCTGREHLRFVIFISRISFICLLPCDPSTDFLLGGGVKEAEGEGENKRKKERKGKNFLHPEFRESDGNFM